MLPPPESAHDGTDGETCRNMKTRACQKMLVFVYGGNQPMQMLPLWETDEPPVLCRLALPRFPSPCCVAPFHLLCFSARGTNAGLRCLQDRSLSLACLSPAGTDQSPRWLHTHRDVDDDPSLHETCDWSDSHVACVSVCLCCCVETPKPDCQTLPRSLLARHCLCKQAKKML